MIYELSKTLLERYNSVSAATLRTLSQGMWQAEASSKIVLGTQNGVELAKSVLPFITFQVIFTDLEQDFCTNFFYPLVQFNIHGDANDKSPREVELVGVEFLSVFGDVLMDMDNGYDMYRNDTVGQRIYKDEQNMWNLIYELYFNIQKVR